MENNTFYTLHLNHQQILEIHRSLLQRFVVEEALRREQGLEPIDYPRLLEHLEEVLGINVEKAHQLFHIEEEALWEYSWFTFTDEWAWFRARQDVLKQLGKNASHTSHKSLEELIEKQYESAFEAYQQEIAMEEPASQKKQTTRRRIRNKKNKE